MGVHGDRCRNWGNFRLDGDSLRTSRVPILRASSDVLESKRFNNSPDLIRPAAVGISRRRISDVHQNGPVREPPLNQEFAIVQAFASEAKVSFRADRFRRGAAGIRFFHELREISVYDATVRLANCAGIENAILRIAAK